MSTSDAISAKGAGPESIDDLRKQYEGLRIMCAQESQAAQELRQTLARRDEIIAQMEDKVRGMEGKHKREMNVAEAERVTVSADWEHRMKALELENLRILDESRMLQGLEKENSDLKQTIIRLESAMEENLIKHRKEIADVRADVMRFKDQLEHEFRERVKERYATHGTRVVLSMGLTGVLGGAAPSAHGCAHSS